MKPLTAEDSLKRTMLREGFRVELVAAEPLVRDPVAIDFDADGRAYVVQLPPYNSYVVPGFKQKGSICRLEDTDGDGRYDTHTLFAENLAYPTAVACWDGGVFVGDAPDLLYLKDTTGDGKADRREIIFTGFGKDKAGESHLNSIRWGFDCRFHFSTNLSGGNVKPVKHVKTPVQPVSVRNRGIVFDPRHLDRFELTSGGGQHGLSMDNQGRKFVCSNSVPAQMLAYDDHYIARNPYVEAPAVAVDIAPGGKYTKLFRISPDEPWRVLRTSLRKEGKFRGSDEGGTPFGFFTGATGITIYRGDAWPAEYRGNLLVGDVANNLVYRARLESKGLGLVARRADAGAEFLASKDIWFRPVQFANAPDGSLYVLDMYRELIEGAAFLPPEFLKHLNAVGGNDRGRIYRIVPNDFQRRPRPRLGEAKTSELVALLDHANGWHRDTASRLIYTRQDVSAVPPLEELARHGKTPEGRMTALHSLRGLNRLDDDLLLAALGDASPGVRSQAVRLAESRFASSSTLQARALRLTADEDVTVRSQLAFSLGMATGVGQVDGLAAIAKRDGADRWMRLAVLTSSRDCAGRLFQRLANDKVFWAAKHGAELLTALAKQIGAAGRRDDIGAVLQSLQKLPATEQTLTQVLVKSLLAKQSGPGRQQILAARGGQAAKVMREILDSAKQRARTESLSEKERAEAVRSLSLGDFKDVRELLTDSLKLTQPPQVQAAAVTALAEFQQSDVADILITAWPRMSPTLRAQTAETLFSRTSWLGRFLDAVEAKKVRRIDVAPSRIALLRSHPDAAIRKRVSAVFSATTTAGRKAVVEKYQPALKLAGDVDRGRKVFRKNCAACHRLEDFGEAVGADLKGIRRRGLASVMLNVLDPNREVKPKFLTYLVATQEGKTITGMIVTENANSVTLRQPDGKSVTVQRANIAALRSTGLSAMPEGLEKTIDVKSMADLLAYLNAVTD